MGLFNRNNKKESSLQQRATSIKPLVPVLSVYRHRLDDQGNPIVRLRFVQSTCEPDFKFTSFIAWVMHVSMMSFYLEKTAENQRRLEWIKANNRKGGAI